MVSELCDTLGLGRARVYDIVGLLDETLLEPIPTVNSKRLYTEHHLAILADAQALGLPWPEAIRTVLTDRGIDTRPVMAGTPVNADQHLRDALSDVQLATEGVDEDRAAMLLELQLENTRLQLQLIDARNKLNDSENKLEKAYEGLRFLRSEYNKIVDRTWRFYISEAFNDMRRAIFYMSWRMTDLWSDITRKR